MLIVTDAAAEAVHFLVAERHLPEGSGLRIRPGSGTSSAVPIVELAQGLQPGEGVVTDRGIRLLIDPQLLPLDDGTVDVVHDGDEVEFVLRSPA
jgi:Fe-S cluster assembly iron-binding protein IscA